MRCTDSSANVAQQLTTAAKEYLELIEILCAGKPTILLANDGVKPSHVRATCFENRNRFGHNASDTCNGDNPRARRVCVPVQINMCEGNRMPEEIERKFLIDLARVKLPPKGRAIKQGYFPIADHAKTVVRVRVSDEKAYLTIKGANVGAVRPEYEYPIPRDDALEMLNNLCQKPLIEKTRYEIRVGRHVWEVDIFEGENRGLSLAEVELASETEQIEIPEWAWQEVTDDSRYYNVNLLVNPFSKWRET